MNRILLAIVCCWAFALAQDSKIRIGILNLVVTGGDKQFAAEASADLVNAIGDVGFYITASQSDMETALTKIRQKLPRQCFDPRSVVAVGQSLGLDRMVYGSLDKNGETYGIKLFLIDVQSRRTIEDVSLASEPGTSITDIIDVAVSKLHGQSDKELNIKTKKYFGPLVHNEKQMLYSTAATIGAGLIVALVEGNFSKAENSIEFTDELSGVSTQEINIPMFGRAASMANSYVAASADAYGVFYNPAGLAWVSGPEAACAYQSRFSNSLTVGALSYVNKATRDVGFGQALFFSGDSLKSEIYTISSIAYKFNQIFALDNPLSVGLSLKMENRKTPESDQTTNPDNQSEKSFGMGFDIGAQLAISEKIKGGIVFKDVLSFVRTNNTHQDYSYIELNPVQFLWGGTYQVGYTTMLIAQLQTPLYSDQRWKFAGGLEQEVFRILRFRAGVSKDAYFDTPWTVTGGLGLVINTTMLKGRYIIIDGAYEYRTMMALSNTLNFSFRLGF